MILPVHLQLPATAAAPDHTIPISLAPSSFFTSLPVNTFALDLSIHLL